MNEEPKPVELNDGHIRTKPEPAPHLDPVPVPPGSPAKVTVPIYGRAWFAYAMGAIVTAGGILAVIPSTVYIGIGITTLCGGWLAWAGLDRQRSAGGATWIDKVLEVIRALLKALDKWIKSKGGSNAN